MTCASRRRACCEAGPCRRACRCGAATAGSPCMWRTTRSSTRRLRARSRPGEYGAGSVEIWDTGTYDVVERKRDGGLTVELHGSRLNGLWTLIPAKMDGDPKNWLLVRKDGSEAGNGRVPKPMLAQLAEKPPAGEGWLHEVKLDGFRAIATVERGRGDAVQPKRQRPHRAVRRGRARPPRAPCGARTASSTARCARSTRRATPGSGCSSAGTGSLVVYLFDILELDGEDVTGRRSSSGARSWRRRSSPATRSSASRSPSRTAPACSTRFARWAWRESFPNVRRAPYQPGKRGGAWVKVKSRDRQEFVIAGYTIGKGRRSKGIGALILAVDRDGDLIYVGNCGTGFDDKELDRLQDLLDPLRARHLPARRGAAHAAGAHDRRHVGRARSSCARSSSPSGRRTSACAHPSTWACATTSRRARSTRASGEGSSRAARSRTSTRCSGPTRASRRAT